MTMPDEGKKVHSFTACGFEARGPNGLMWHRGAETWENLTYEQLCKLELLLGVQVPKMLIEMGLKEHGIGLPPEPNP